MNFKNSCLFVALLCCAAAPLAAQPPPGDKAHKVRPLRYLLFDYGLGYNHSLDTRMSLSPYKGPGARIGFGMQAEKPHRRTEYQYASGRVDRILPAHLESLVWNSRYDGAFSYLRKVKPLAPRKWDRWLGGSLLLSYNFRYAPRLSNSAVHWDGVAAIGPTAALRTPLRFFRADWLLDGRLSLPLLAYVNRLPAYALSGWGGTANYVAPIGRYTRLSTFVALSKRLGKLSPNRWQLSYAWDFYAFNESDIHRLRIANHSLTYTLWVKL